jgi:hypothetical protein
MSTYPDRYVITGISEHTGKRVWLYFDPEGGGWWQWGSEQLAKRFEDRDNEQFEDAMLCAPKTGPWYDKPKEGTIEVRPVPAIVTVS